MVDTVNTDAKKAFFQHIMGPRGGLFALGIFIGMFVMHVYMSEFVYKEQIAALNARISTLEKEKETSRAEIGRLRLRLEEIAFDRMEEDE